LRAVSAARDVTVDVNADEVEDRILCGTNFDLRRGVTTRASNDDERARKTIINHRRVIGVERVGHRV
jgi:hypothetical protein